MHPPRTEPPGHPAGVLEPPDSDGPERGPHPRGPRHHEGVVLPSAEGQTLGRLPAGRVTRTPDGLIDTVDGRPVNDFLKDVGRLRGEQIRQLRADRVVSKGETGYATAVVLDRRTGEIFEASNGDRFSVIEEGRVHPLLSARRDSMVSGPGYPATNRDGSLDSTGQRPHPHPDRPMGHAEVKAINGLLWRHGVHADASVLRDVSVEVVGPFGSQGVRALPFCANCAILLHDVPSINGRFTGWPPGDHNFLRE